MNRVSPIEPSSANGVQPTLKIGLSGKTSPAFVFDELTINPFFPPDYKRRRGKCDLWVEFVIRYRGRRLLSISDFPDITVHLRDFTDAYVRPTVQLDDATSKIDLNIFAYAEIWCSFVPSSDGRGDFMRTGYKNSCRLISDNPSFAGTASALQISSTEVSDSELRYALDDLSQRLLLLQDIPLTLSGANGSYHSQSWIRMNVTTSNFDQVKVSRFGSSFRPQQWQNMWVRISRFN